MRLLHAKDLTFREFPGRDIPEYAIISHRWSDEEVSYQEFVRDRQKFIDGECKGYGWTKITMACKIALREEYLWVWMDTICIDKTSSAELTEAINSTYDWYESSEVCLVFLPDVHRVDGVDHTLIGHENDQSIPDSGDLDDKMPSPNGDTEKYFDSSEFYCFDAAEFKDSEWFSRAWTLQELLAPPRLSFYNSNYDCIGQRDSVASLISERTDITEYYLKVHPDRGPHPDLACIAERMKWASKRIATREEDSAYSLLGLFRVNMPMLYGEGRSRAFRRLQLEIIKRSDDESILTFLDRRYSTLPPGILARDIKQFSQTATIERGQSLCSPPALRNDQ